MLKETLKTPLLILPQEVAVRPKLSKEPDTFT